MIRLQGPSELMALPGSAAAVRPESGADALRDKDEALRSMRRERDAALRAHKQVEAGREALLASLESKLLEPLTVVIGFAEVELRERLDPQSSQSSADGMPPKGAGYDPQRAAQLDRLERIIRAGRDMELAIAQLIRQNKSARPR